MFIRLKTNKTSKHPTVQIAESFRDGNRVRQRVIASLGVVRDDAGRERLINLGHALINKLKNGKQLSLFQDLAPATVSRGVSKKGKDFVNPKALVHVRDIPCGFDDVYGRLSEQLGFDALLREIDAQGRRDFVVRDIIQMVISMRLREPASKRRTLFFEAKETGCAPCELHQVYRAMDAIESYSEQFQSLAFRAATDLLNRRVECFFYDATTLYFESVDQDEVRDFGYSKDGKFYQVQCLLVLVVTEEGLPVAFEVFSGNTQETKTFQRAIDALSKRFEITKCTIVCDRGILSGSNLDFAANEKKMHYIVGEKLRKLPKKYHELISDKTSYQQQDEILIKEIAHPTRKDSRLILCFSEKRAKKDKSDRERLLKKLKKRLTKKKQNKPQDFIPNSGVKKYLNTEGGTASLNLEAIAREEKWDGFWGITTNHPALDPLHVLYQYRGLWQVEATIRVAKHDLRTRPIFHWSPHRVKAHILICFIALVLERHLEVLLKKQGTPLTTQNIHDALSYCKRIVFQEKSTHRLFEMDSNKPEEAKTIYRTLGIPWRRETRELPTPNGNVVPSVDRVKPEAYGIPAVLF